MIPADFLMVLQSHRDFTPRLLLAAQGRMAQDVEWGQSRLDRRIRSMVKEVSSEVHRMKGMVRLAPAGDRIMCGYLKPRHDIGFMVAGHLARRFAGTLIVLGNAHQSWACQWQDGRLCCRRGGPLGDMLDRLGAKQQVGAEAIWDAYYPSQETGGSSLEAFTRHMPAKAQRAAGSRERRTGTTLEDFV